MSLKYLSVDEMLELTNTWVDMAHADRRVLARMSSVGGLLPLVDEAHRELGRARNEPNAPPPRDLTAKLMAKDLRHDSYVRVAWYALEAHIHLSIAKGHDRTANELEQLKNKLLPDGLSLVDYSYREESSQAHKLENRMTAEDRAVLAHIPISDASLLDAVNAWIRAGKSLGKLQQQHEVERLKPKGNRLQDARNKWIRAVKTVRMVLDLMGHEKSEIQGILDNITRLERAAEERMRDGYAQDASGRIL